MIILLQWLKKNSIQTKHFVLHVFLTISALFDQENRFNPRTSPLLSPCSWLTGNHSQTFRYIFGVTVQYTSMSYCYVRRTLWDYIILADVENFHYFNFRLIPYILYVFVAVCSLFLLVIHGCQLNCELLLIDYGGLCFVLVLKVFVCFIIIIIISDFYENKISRKLNISILPDFESMNQSETYENLSCILGKWTLI